MSVVEKCSVYGSPPEERMMYDPEPPTPMRIFNIGPPKQAENPIIGANVTTEILATKSASELPTAKIVSPMIASDRPKMKPKV